MHQFNCFESYPSTHAQDWAVWSKPTLFLMHVMLTARHKKRVYSKLVFKTYKKASGIIGFGNCPSRTWSFIVKHNALTHNRRRFGQQAAAVVELNCDWMNCFTRMRDSGLGHLDWVIATCSI